MPLSWDVPGIHPGYWDTWTGGVGATVLGYSWDTPMILGNPGILGQGGVGATVLGYSWDTPRILGNPGVLGQGGRCQDTRESFLGYLDRGVGATVLG